jgi:hypothetical protein
MPSIVLAASVAIDGRLQAPHSCLGAAPALLQTTALLPKLLHLVFEVGAFPVEKSHPIVSDLQGGFLVATDALEVAHTAL